MRSQDEEAAQKWYKVCRFEWFAYELPGEGFYIPTSRVPFRALELEVRSSAASESIAGLPLGQSMPYGVNSADSTPSHARKVHLLWYMLMQGRKLPRQALS